MADPADLQKLANLPWTIQLALGAGYAGYFIAFVGIRDHHKAIDTAFRVVVFSLVATGALALLGHFVPAQAAAPIAFVITVVAGACWRLFGQRTLIFILRVTNVSWSDDVVSSLGALTDNTRHPVTQIAVLTTTGSWLSCDDTARFANAPFGPCRIGQNGDVALYVTQEETADHVVTEMLNAMDEAWGDQVTFVPANQIARLVIRHSRS